jgi:ankyrin repeat protein
LIAASGGHRGESVALLLNAGADKDFASKMDGRTALIRAAEKGNLEAVKLLVAARADRNAKDKKGFTALEHAVANKHYAVVQLLSSSNDPGARDEPPQR